MVGFELLFAIFVNFMLVDCDSMSTPISMYRVQLGIVMITDIPPISRRTVLPSDSGADMRASASQTTPAMYQAAPDHLSYTILTCLECWGVTYLS
ncbi:hypothetical protein BDW59DRAFT_153544 [Aspergillus cavernicola]|uniref:Secreted protein n=1 Tax=Aspergillus cavernicola TaxID=176166 RepID=A0ABR4HK22_9EURO